MLHLSPWYLLLSHHQSQKPESPPSPHSFKQSPGFVGSAFLILIRASLFTCYFFDPGHHHHWPRVMVWSPLSCTCLQPCPRTSRLHSAARVTFPESKFNYLASLFHLSPLNGPPLPTRSSVASLAWHARPSVFESLPPALSGLTSHYFL